VQSALCAQSKYVYNQIFLRISESIDMENHYKTNFSNFVPCKELGINRDSEECFKKWQEIDDFYNKTFNGDFIEKYIQVKFQFN